MGKLSQELAEITDKIDEYKDMLESKDSGMNDTSPLVRIKAALQQIKAEIAGFDLRIGVVSHSLLTAKHAALKSTRQQQIRATRQKNKKGGLRRGDAGQLETSTQSLDEPYD